MEALDNEKKLNSLFLFLFDKSFNEIKKIENFEKIDKWDSLNFAGLVVGLQKEFSLELNEHQFETLKSFSGLKKILKKNGINLN